MISYYEEKHKEQQKAKRIKVPAPMRGIIGKMDPVTHGLTGVVLSNLGIQRKHALWVLIISSLAPDFDYITRLWGADVFLRYHRGITHGVLALFAVPLVIGLLFGRRKDFLRYFFLSLLAYGSHLFMDLTNQYGTRILSPFDWDPYALDLVFIIDPYITLGFLASVLLCNVLKKKRGMIAIATILLFIVYIGGRAYLHGKTEEFVREKVEATTYKVYPLPNDFLRWWFVARSKDEIKTGFADLLSQRVCVQDTYPLPFMNPLIKKSEETAVVRNFLSFAKYPYAYVTPEGDKRIVTWKELSYSFRAGDHFVAKIIYDKEGRAEEAYFRF